MTLILRNQVEQQKGISQTPVMPRRRNLKAIISASVFIVCTAESAFAGMPSFVLRDVYRLRFQEVSFFVFLLLVSALLFQIAWNLGFKDFQSLPRLNYKRAFALSVLFGLMMLLVLTMISGIREVLTPGAWRKQGSTYRLNDPSMEPVRRRSMEHLRVALMEYARTHDGRQL